MNKEYTVQFENQNVPLKKFRSKELRKRMSLKSKLTLDLKGNNRVEKFIKVNINETEVS